MSSKIDATIDTLLNEWYIINNEKKTLERQDKDYRKKVIQFMEKNNIDSINHRKYKIKKRTSRTKKLNKKFCPEDVWKKYAEEYEYTSCTIEKK